MTYKTKWELAINPDNINLAMMAIVDVALELLANPATNATVAAYAAATLNSPESYAKRMIVGVAQQAEGTADNQIKTAVEAVFPYYAGVQAVAA